MNLSARLKAQREARNAAIAQRAAARPARPIFRTLKGPLIGRMSAATDSLRVLDSIKTGASFTVPELRVFQSHVLTCYFALRNHGADVTCAPRLSALIDRMEAEEPITVSDADWMVETFTRWHRSVLQLPQKAWDAACSSVDAYCMVNQNEWAGLGDGK